MSIDRSRLTKDLSYAPYNFVPFPDKLKIRYEKFEDLPKHDEAGTEKNGLLSGQLTFDIVAKTPILVAQGNADSEDRNRIFNRDAWSRYEIPGSTLCGLIRNAVGIIGHSDLRGGVDSQDQTLMYRGLADSASKGLGNRRKEYVRIISKNTVKAGYIRMTGEDRYEIIPAKKINGKTYTFIREQQLYKEGVLPSPDINAMYTKDILEIEKIGRPKPPRKKMSPRAGRTENITDKKDFLDRYKKRLHEYHAKLSRLSTLPKDRELLDQEYNELYGMYYSFLKHCQSEQYAPYITKRSVYITGHGKYTFQPGQGSKYECALMSSGFMQKKQSHYLIHPVDEQAKPVELRLKEVHWYRYDLRVKGNRLKHEDFYKLPENIGELKPCFYVEDDGFTFFGFTPNLRVFYWRTIGEGLPKYPETGFDYVQAMFGFSDVNEKSYAGRLSFKSAIFAGDPGTIRKEEVVTGQPSLSAIAMYIKQDNSNELKTLNDDYEWRGIKQYWLKRDFEKPEKNMKSPKKDNEQVKSILHLLPKGTTFKAAIRFDLLHKDELGLLLAALTWPKHQLIGMGKPFGAGCVTFENIRLFFDNVTYRLDHFFANDLVEIPKDQFEEYIESFCEQMKSVCDDVKQSVPVRVYLAMRENVYDHIDKQYMPVSERDGYPAYQSFLPLPTVGQLLWNEPITLRETTLRQQQDQRLFQQQQVDSEPRKQHKPDKKRRSQSQQSGLIDERWAKLFQWEKDNKD